MKLKRLNRGFFMRPTLDVAKDMLGKFIVRQNGNKKIEGKIIETEAYIGPIDKASHAYLPSGKFHLASEKLFKKLSAGKMADNAIFLKNFKKTGGKLTERNLAEYFVGGHIYIYLVYGMYWQLNFSTEEAGKPECVLIRALDLGKEADGPGKLCRYLKLDKSFYGEDVVVSKKIWLEDRGKKIEPSKIIATKRIGIDYAGPYWAKRKWRFVFGA